MMKSWQIGHNMSKRISSSSSRWPGSVVIGDPLTLPQALAWEKAVNNSRKLEGDITMTDINYALMPGICACVEKWELEGLENVTPETFPASPRKESGELIDWLIGEIAQIYRGEEAKADPNE
jgi:hypothetical protein